MTIRLKYLQITLIIAGLLLTAPLLLETETQELENDLNGQKLVIFQDNTLFPFSDLSEPEPEVVQKIRVVITGYSSSPLETDSDPFITANGTWVRDGIIANNLLSFGTKVRIPEIYGDKVFTVEDRMNRRKGSYHFDIWFPNRWEALNFGAKRTYIEVLES